MRIKSFKAKKVHKRQNFDIKFFKDISFLIGINGSGKTTVVRAIHSLISPHLPALAFLEFEEMSLSLEIGREIIIIRAKQLEDGIEISVSTCAEPLFIPKFEMPSNEFPHKYSELFTEYYRTQASVHLDHDVMKTIRALPTPMYLGLERRMLDEKESPRTRYVRSFRRNIFAGALLASLDEASELAVIKLRQFQEKEDKLKDKLRNKLLLGNFEYVNALATPTKKLPTRTEREAISKQKGRIRETLVKLGLPEDEISNNVDEFFRKITELLAKLPESFPKNPSDLPKEVTDTVLTWHFNQWQYNKALQLISNVNEFVDETNKLYSSIRRFLDSINNFFEDSGKKIEINRFGMQVIHRDGLISDLSSLSSGEQQLVVLLTHLAFNDSAVLANILIIDEPELSLHIAWQEKFADALLSANPETQFILATHSPSIILERSNKCIELLSV